MFVLLLSVFHLNFETERKVTVFTTWRALHGTFTASLYDTFLNPFDFLKYCTWNIWPELRLFFFSSLSLSWALQEPEHIGTWLSSSTVPSSGCSRGTLQWLTTYSIPPAIMKPEMFEKKMLLLSSTHAQQCHKGWQLNCQTSPPTRNILCVLLIAQSRPKVKLDSVNSLSLQCKCLVGMIS